MSLVRKSEAYKRRQEKIFYQQQSKRWFELEANRLLREEYRTRTEAVRKEGKPATTVFNGELIFFNYSPKTKPTLPHWDTFPVVLVLAILRNGFIGINFHYLHYEDRVKLFILLREQHAIQRHAKNEKISVKWKDIKNIRKFRLFKYAIKRYLYSRVKSRVKRINKEEWIKVIHTNLELFYREPKTQVWKGGKRKSYGIK